MAEMETVRKVLGILEQQEADLVFDSFTHRDALTLGTMLAETISEYKSPLTVRVFIGDVIVYQYSMKGWEQVRFWWTMGKYQVVKATGHSSTHGKVRLKHLGELTDLAEQKDTYGFGCGAFPITVKGEGIIGGVAVSGLPDPDDHVIVVHALEKLLGKKTAELPNADDRDFY